jgi:hypothetical protein
MKEMTRHLAALAAATSCWMMMSDVVADVPIQPGLWSETRIAPGDKEGVTTKSCKSDRDVAQLKALLDGSSIDAPKGRHCRVVDNTGGRDTKIAGDLVCSHADKDDAGAAAGKTKITGSVSESDYDVWIGKVRFIGHRLGNCGASVEKP